jgi:hypothetical protein
VVLRGVVAQAFSWGRAADSLGVPTRMGNTLIVVGVSQLSYVFETAQFLRGIPGCDLHPGIQAVARPSY